MKSVCFFCILLFLAGCTTVTSSQNSDGESPATKLEKADSHYQLGLSALNKGDFIKAKRHIATAIEISPDTPYYYNHLGIVYFQEHNYEKARELFEKAHAIDPKYSDALNNLGALYLQEGNLTKAKEYFLLVASDQLYPYPYYVETNLGIIARMEKEYSTAEKFFKKALRKKGTFCDAYKELAILYDEEGKEDESIENYKKTLQYCPYYVEALYRGAIKLLIKKDTSTGTQYLKRCLDIEQNNISEVTIPYLKECVLLAKQYGVTESETDEKNQQKKQLEGGF